MPGGGFLHRRTTMTSPRGATGRLLRARLLQNESGQPGPKPKLTAGRWLLIARLPREMRKRLVRLRHLDGVLAFRHRLAFAAVGGHQLVGEAKEHRAAGLAAR